MTHNNSDITECLHHSLYKWVRGRTGDNQYVGTVKMGEEELERALFHPNNVSYNWLAYWKRHPDGRDSEGSWKLRYPRHSDYVERGMQIHITLFPSTENPDWIDVYAHYEWDNIRHPIRHIREDHFSPKEGVDRARNFIRDNRVDLYHLRNT